MPNKSSKNGSARFWQTPSVEDAGRTGSQQAWSEWETEGRTTQCRLRNQVHASIPTSSPSTEPTTPGLTCSQGDFLVSLSVSPGSDSARQMTVRSGLKCSELYKRQDPLGSLVRMLLESSRWNSTISYLTWKASATPRGRLLFRLVPSMPDTEGTEFGLWPTPATRDHHAQGANHNVKAKSSSLATVIQKKGGAMWPTPRAGKTTDETEEAWTLRRDAGKVSTPPLTLAVKMWPTPTALEFKDSGANWPLLAKLDKGGRVLRRIATLATNEERLAGGSLNPQFVEWLMGYPKDWTVLEHFASGRTKTSARQESAPESNIAPTVCAGWVTRSARPSLKKSSD